MRTPLLFLHITGGIVGLLSGTFAMAFRKGSQRHRVSGDAFVVSMLIMAACGSVLSVMKHQTNNVFGSALTFYMITTAWLAGRRRENSEASPFDYAALVMALALSSALMTLGIRVVMGLTRDEGVPIFMYFFMGTIPLLAAAGDIRMLVRGPLSGKQRLTRHLWRMLVGLFIATGSFFLGQQQVFPEILRKQYLLVPLGVLPLILLIYWLARVSLVRRAAAALHPRWQEPSPGAD